MNRIAEILRDSKTPLIIVRKVGETASAEATLNAFTDGGEGYAIVSNSDEIHSPTSGEKLTPVEGLTETIKDTEFSELSEMVVEGETAYTLLMDPDLAFDLSGETFKSPVDGKDITVEYKQKESESVEENADDGSDDSESDDSKDSDKESEDESNDEDSDDIDEDLDSGIEEVDAEDDDIDLDVDADVDSELEGDDEGTEGDDSEGLEETDKSDKDAEEVSEEEPESVSAADTVLTLEATHNNDEPLRLVQMDEKGTEVAAFSGINYIGSLHRPKAATNVQPLFDNGQKLYQSFKLVLKNNTELSAAEVVSFGFTPAVHKIAVSKLVGDAIENAKATTVAEVASSTTGFKDRFQKVLGLSILGINKGFFEGANSLVTETASILAKAGVKNSEAVVRRALVKASEQYSATVMEKASELHGQSDDYLRGVSESITKTEFKGQEVPENLTTIYSVPEVEPKGETAGFRSTFKKPVSGNRYAGIVGGLGRRA